MLLAEWLVGTSGHVLFAFGASTEAAALGAVMRAGTAANSEHPEEAGTQGECNTQPGPCQEGCVKVTLNTVPVSSALDNADNEGSHHSGKNGPSDYNNACYSVDDEGDTAPRTAAGSKNTEKQLDAQADHAGNIGNLSPLGKRGETLHGSLDSIGKNEVLVGEGGGGLELLEGIIENVVGPVVGRLLAGTVAVLFGDAVAPEGDIVEVAKAKVSGSDVGAAAAAAAAARVVCVLVQQVGGMPFEWGTGGERSAAKNIVYIYRGRAELEVGYVCAKNVKVLVSDSSQTRH